MDAEHSIHIELDEFRTMITTSLDGFLVVTVTGRILDANDSYCRLMGYLREELINMHISEVDAIESPEDVFNRVEEIVQRGVLRFETKHRHKNGSIIDFEVCSNYSSSHGGRFFSFFRDITEKKRTRDIIATRIRLLEYATNHTMEELLRETLDEAEKLTDSCVGFYHLLNSDQEMLTLQACSTRTATQFCKAEGTGSHYHISQAGVWGDCVLERRAVIHNDYAALSHRKGMPEGHVEVVRELLVPVFRKGAIVAILGIGNKRTDYDQRDVDLASLLADLAFTVIEHKQSESLNLFTSEIMKNMTEGVLLIQCDNGSISYANPKFEKMFGYEPGELVGKDVSIVNAPSEQTPDETKKTIMDILAKTGEWHGEVENIKKDGTHFWCYANVSIFESLEHGKVFVSVHTDITERKQAENALRASEHLFKALVSASSQSAWSFRPGGLSQIEQIDRANASWWCEFTGQTEMERAANGGMGWLDAVYDADREIARSNWQNILTATEPTSAAFRVRRRDGNLRWLQVRGVPILDDQRSIIEIAGTVTDVTEQRQAELSLQKLSSEMERLLETSATGLTRCSRDLYYLSANTAYAKLAGVPREQIVGRPIVDVMGEEGLAAIMPYVNRVLHGERVEYETPVPFRGGVAQYLHVIYTPDVDEQGDIVGWVASVTDITERIQTENARKQLENQLQQTQRLESLGVLAGGIAHDFNNILAIIMGHCSLTEMDYEKAPDHIPEIEKAVARAAELCRQMLAYAGKAQFVQAQVNIGELVEEIVKMLKTTIKQNVVIIPTIATDIPLIKADASQIRQIAMNLIINGAEAIGDAQGEVQVTLSKISIKIGQSEKDYLGKLISAGWYACLEVTDNGSGMSDETYNRIFEPFYSTKFTGRGLGMSAVLGIVTAQGGALQLFSQLGTGTTFKVYLPLQSSDSAADETQKITNQPESWLGNGVILLVEDEDQILQVAKAMLMELGFRVIEAKNGKEAIEQYQKNIDDINLVLTDMGMPVMDGYALINELKKRNPELPIIISSGFGEAEITSRILQNDIAGLIGKPYNFNVLRNVLKSVMEGKSKNIE